MIRKLRENINISIAQSPRKAVLVGIMLFNVVFIVIAALIISILSKQIDGLAECSFWVAVYRTITMILDAGCIDNVIEDVGKAGAFAAIVCIAVVILGMVFFSGAVIGYITNIISDFIDSKNNGKNKLVLSDHVVIINWNPRALEIINEFLYQEKNLKVVVLVQDNKDEIDEEIRNRLDTSILKEENRLLADSAGMGFFEKRKFYRENRLRDRLTCIVREGDVAAARDLDDICISRARTVIILDDAGDKRERGNAQTIKTLIQVSEISKANRSQTILVEVLDDWTEELVNKIMAYNAEEKQEVIVPILFDRLLGEAYSQIAVNPKLRDEELYDKLFEDRVETLVADRADTDASDRADTCASDRADTCASDRADTCASDRADTCEFETGKRTLLILGHNSKMDSLMAGVDTYRDKLSIVIVDNQESLLSHDNYSQYPNVETLAADMYDDETINDKVYDMYQKVPDETTVLILSDDTASSADTDADALTYLIYIQECISQCEESDPTFSRDKVSVVVEVQNPKNEEIVLSYGADRVIISNKYVSHIIAKNSL